MDKSGVRADYARNGFEGLCSSLSDFRHHRTCGLGLPRKWGAQVAAIGAAK
jgi:hypothetical protein